MINNRISTIFSNNKKKLITFVTGGDPDFETSKQIIEHLAISGADIIEIGMPFSDPMADGPTIQLSSLRAIKKGMDLNKIFNNFFGCFKIWISTSYKGNKFFFIIRKNCFYSIIHQTFILSALATVKISLSPLPHIFITIT